MGTLKTESLTGTTVDALTAILDINTTSIKSLRTIIKNTGLVNNLSVKITTKNIQNGALENIEVPLTTLTPGSTLTYIHKFAAEMIEYVQSTVPGAPTTYTLEYIWSNN